MRSYKFNIGDLLKLTGNIEGISSPANPSKMYHDNLRVVFRFWDGKDNVYVVTAEDGIGLFLVEHDAELQEAAIMAPGTEELRTQGSETDNDGLYHLSREEMLEFAQLITYNLDDRLVPCSRETLRSEAWLLGYEFAKAHK